jgi:hypothetical protein
MEDCFTLLAMTPVFFIQKSCFVQFGPKYRAAPGLLSDGVEVSLCRNVHHAIGHNGRVVDFVGAYSLLVCLDSHCSILRARGFHCPVHDQPLPLGRSILMAHSGIT